MKWRGREGSGNIEDRRGMRTGRTAGAGVGGVGVVALLVIGYFLGIDVTPLLNGSSGITIGQDGGGEITEADQQAGQFVSVVLADTEKVWADAFRTQLGREYVPPTLVLFKGATQSPCGGASGATGPFYCPGDKKVYLDTAFFATMQQRMGAGGDFAAAYVVAHEVGHSIQDQLGILGKTTEVRRQVSEVESNDISVRVELQADCFSGIWARQAESQLGTLDAGDLEEALNAASQIGDDTLQRNAGQRPMPDSFTHGTSEQRQRWLATGYQGGDIASCDTFGTDAL